MAAIDNSQEINAEDRNIYLLPSKSYIRDSSIRELYLSLVAPLFAITFVSRFVIAHAD